MVDERKNGFIYIEEGRCLSVFNFEGNESTEAKIVEEYERRMKGRSIYSSREI